MIVKKLELILRQSWNKKTCCNSFKDNWDSANPSLGQCAVTALIVNDFCGGQIMRCMTSTGSHYYNLIKGQIIDLTREQFGDEEPLYNEGSERTRDYLLSNLDTKERYLLLLKRVKHNFQIYGDKYYKLTDENGLQILSKIPGTLGGNKLLKIYGKFDCPSAARWIEKGFYVKNRTFFASEEIAIQAGYRPCAICMPLEYQKWKEEFKVLKKTK